MSARRLWRLGGPVTAIAVLLVVTAAPGFELPFRGAGAVGATSASSAACTDDPFEPDNDAASARPIAVGETQTHFHCDPDWISFGQTRGTLFVIETSNLKGGADTVLEVYEGSSFSSSCVGTTFSLAASDDNGGEGRASRVVYRPGCGGPDEGAGGYRAAILEAGGAYAEGKGYDVSLRCLAGCAGVVEPLFVPAAAHAHGQAGALFQTDLSIFNPSFADASAELLFTPTDSDGASSRITRTITVHPGETRLLPDVVRTLFDLESGAGSIEIRASAAELLAGSRIYDASRVRVLGEFVPAVPVSASSGQKDQVHLYPLTKSAAFRSNVGFCETTGGRVGVRVTLLDASGKILGSKTYALPPWGHHQINDVFVELGVPAAEGVRATVQSSGSAGRILAYATVNDNVTNDGLVTTPEGFRAEAEVFPATFGSGLDQRSDVAILNPDVFTREVQVAFYPVSGAAPPPKTFPIAPSQLLVLDDLASVVGATGPGTFALSGSFAQAKWRAHAGPVPGSYGLTRPAALSSAAVSSGTFTALPMGGPPGRHLSFMLFSFAPSAVTVSLVSTDGRFLGQKEYELSPIVPIQIDDAFQELGVTPGTEARLQVETPTRSIFQGAISSVWAVDPATGDGVALPLQPITAGLTLPLTLPGGVPLELVRQPGGAFLMGSPEDEPERDGDEAQHPVTLTRPCFVGTIEVTEGQWNAVVGLPGGSDKPVVNVSWQDVAGPGGFIEKLNSHLTATGQSGAGLVRLPTEAEWEKAVRQGTTTRFPFGDLLGCLGTNARCVCPSANFALTWCGNSGGGPSPSIPQFGGPPFNMAGNVWEWVADRYAPFDGTRQVDPQGPADGAQRVIRGGGWNSELRLCRSANRFSYPPDARFDYVGFRVAASVP